MSGLQKRQNERACNCRNSKCTKLYCECFSANVSCNKHCRCLNCQNKQQKYYFHKQITSEQKRSKESRGTKGCCCRKTGCIKKYCQCFQTGMKCSQVCKCIQCQNQETMDNRNIGIELTKNNSKNTIQQKLQYPFNEKIQHFSNVVNQQNIVGMDDQYLQSCGQMMVKAGNTEHQVGLLLAFLQILNDLDKHLSQNHSMQKQQEKFKPE